MTLNTTKSFNLNEVKVNKAYDVYRGYFSIKSYNLTHKLFDGSWSNEIHRECFMRKPVVAVLLFDPVLESVVLIKQFRIGALKDKTSPWLVEIVAGIIDDNQTPEQTALRESIEEANVTPKELIKIMEYWTSPGGSNEYLYLYLGIVDASQAGGVYGLKSENEDIEVCVYPAKQAFDFVKSGAINNAATILSLQWLQLSYQRIIREFKKCP